MAPDLEQRLNRRGLMNQAAGQPVNPLKEQAAGNNEQAAGNDMQAAGNDSESSVEIETMEDRDEYILIYQDAHGMPSWRVEEVRL